MRLKISTGCGRVGWNPASLLHVEARAVSCHIVDDRRQEAEERGPVRLVRGELHRGRWCSVVRAAMHALCSRTLACGTHRWQIVSLQAGFAAIAGVEELGMECAKELCVRVTHRHHHPPGRAQ